MTEEAQVSDVNDTPQDSTEDTQKTETQSAKPAGYDPVDWKTASPEEIEARTNYIYGQLKSKERSEREAQKALNEYRKIAAEQAKQLAEVTTVTHEVVNHLQQKTFADNEASLQRQMAEAFEKGDLKTHLELQTKLIDLQVEKRMTRQTAPAKAETTQYRNAAEIAADDPDMTDADNQVIKTWQDERDESGNMLRSWAHSNDPRYQDALAEASAVFNSPRFAHLTTEQKLNEVDKRMGTQKRAPSQSVMGGGLNAPRKVSKLTLSPDQERLAVKTKYGGPSAKSDAEHIEAYRKQVERVKQLKGSRK